MRRVRERLAPRGETRESLESEALRVKTQAEREYQSRSENDFMLFVRGLVIPSAHGPQVLGTCLEPFQVECFKALAPSLVAVRNGDMPNRRRFWVERTKKASKDGDLAICVLWLLAFPVRPVLIQISAANGQQAGIVKRRIDDILFYNPWLKNRVDVQTRRVVGYKGLGNAVIEATDSSASTDKASGGKQGDTPDVLILNELVHVAKWGVNVTHMNNADGVPQGIAIISTNAGFKGTPQWKWREAAKNNPKRWTMLLRSDPAPWISKEDIDDARRRDPTGIEYARLWRGQWVSGVGGAVDENSIDRCFCLNGPINEPESGWSYVAGLDLGISHDHAGIAILGTNYREQRIRVATILGFRPTLPNNKGVLEVDLEAVKNACHELSKIFRVRWFGYDPAAGGSYMAQQLRKLAVPMREWTFGSVVNRKLMAEKFVTALKNGKLECYEDEDGRLRRDFGKFRVVPKIPSGYILEAVSDEWGHADVGTALIICLPKAVSLLEGNLSLGEEDVLWEEDRPLSKEEQAAMPELLSGIIDAYKGAKRGKPRLKDAYKKEDEGDILIREAIVDYDATYGNPEEEQEY